MVESRDAEIRHLKTDNEKLREEATRFSYDSASGLNSPLKQFAQVQLGGSSVSGAGSREYESIDIGGDVGGEWVEQYHEDFSDVITSQAEINRLRAELTQVKKELHQCKTKAHDKVSTIPIDVCYYVCTFW